MNKTDAILIKTCSICGLEKPLDSFLQYVSADGVIYGNICASCREIQKNKSKSQADDLSSQRYGLTIDSKARKKSEFDKRKHRQDIQEEQELLKEKSDDTKADLEKKIDSKTKDDKLRKTYFEQRSFLGDTKGQAKKNIAGPLQSAAPTVGREAESRREVLEQESATEAKKEELDTTSQLNEFQLAGEKIRSSEIVRQFANYNPGMYVSRMLQKQAGPKTTPAGSKTESTENEATNKDVKNFINNTWRRR